MLVLVVLFQLPLLLLLLLLVSLVPLVGEWGCAAWDSAAGVQGSPGLSRNLPPSPPPRM